MNKQLKKTAQKLKEQAQSLREQAQQLEEQAKELENLSNQSDGVRKTLKKTFYSIKEWLEEDVNTESSHKKDVWEEFRNNGHPLTQDLIEMVEMKGEEDISINGKYLERIETDYEKNGKQFVVLQWSQDMTKGESYGMLKKWGLHEQGCTMFPKLKDNSQTILMIPFE